MLYLTKTVLGKEILVAIFGNEKQANEVMNCIWDKDDEILIQTKSLYNLLKENVEIPPALAWIVESDRKFQEREIESRTENLCGLNTVNS